MENIQIKNVRSLSDTGIIKLAPITVLVGENSSGKSTFLRTFPLLKQSIKKKTNGPILWAGDVDDYVDFGSFEETIGDASENSLCFSFSFSPELADGFFLNAPSLENISIREKFETCYTIVIKKAERREYVSNFSLKINKTAVNVWFDENGKSEIEIDGEKIESVINTDPIERERTFAYLINRKAIDTSCFNFLLPDVDEWIQRNILSKEKKLTKKDFSDTIITESVNYLMGRLLINDFSAIEIEKIIKDLIEYETDVQSRKVLQKAQELIVKVKSISKDQTKKWIIASKLYFIYTNYRSIEAYLRSYFYQVHYIAPLRATAERYYRLRNSAIDEVDYQGKNLAIFLYSLPEKRMQAFQEWTLKNFGFKVTVETTAGHLSLYISLKENDKRINLSDTGFGYSQILPIITQLWELSSRKHSNEYDMDSLDIPLVIAIEQPELHLHPAMQAKLASAFIACLDLARENGYKLQLILETHSQTIVNYFGQAIAKNQLAAEDIVIELFEKNTETGVTSVRTSTFDSDGYLQNWPIGFFSPGV